MADVKQSQKAGDGAAQMMAGQDINATHNQTVNITGITVTEARQTALDVFKANALELAGIARDLFEARGREFIELYLEELLRRKPEALGSFRDPDMQYALFNLRKTVKNYEDVPVSQKLLKQALGDRIFGAEKLLEIAAKSAFER